MEYLRVKFYGWENLRKDMAKKPTFVEGTSIKIKQTHNAYPWTFSRSPLECEVPLQSLEKSIIYLLHTLSYYLQQKRSKASEMPALSRALSQILDLILEKAPEYFESISGPITVANLLIVIDQCCWRIMQFRNLIDVKSDLMLEENGVKARKIVEMVSENLDLNPMKMVHAAAKNVICRFDEKLEFLNEINGCNDRHNVVKVSEPEYDVSCNKFSGARDKMFSRKYHKIIIVYRNTVKITETNINFFGDANYAAFYCDELKHSRTNNHELGWLSLHKELCALSNLNISYEFIRKEEHTKEYNALLDSFFEMFEKRFTEMRSGGNPEKNFSRLELKVIFKFVVFFLYFCPNQLRSNINIYMMKRYVIKFCYVCQNLSIKNVILNASADDLREAMAFADLLLDIEECDVIKPDIITLTMILSKLRYLTAPNLGEYGSFTALENSRTNPVVFKIRDLPLFKSVQDIPRGVYTFWRNLLSNKDNQTRRDILLNLDVGDCAICLEEIDPKANLYILSCTHTLCLRCIKHYESTELR